jgi:hypothetical protein
MSYHKKTTSKPLEKLRFRVDALESVDAEFDFGGGMNAAQLEQFQSELEESINGYNQSLADADALRDTISELERQANDVSERLLAIVLGNYGRDSVEYQRMGGVRKSEITPTGSRPVTYNSDSSAEGSSTDTRGENTSP